MTDARRYATIARNGKGKKIRRGKKKLSRLLFLPESIGRLLRSGFICPQYITQQCRTVFDVFVRDAPSVEQAGFRSVGYYLLELVFRPHGNESAFQNPVFLTQVVVIKVRLLDRLVELKIFVQFFFGTERAMRIWAFFDRVFVAALRGAVAPVLHIDTVVIFGGISFERLLS